MYYDVNLTTLFEEYGPYDVSNSVANLGPCAARLTWDCAMACAKSGALDCVPLSGIHSHISESGMDPEELDAMTVRELRAYLAQEIASDIMEVQDSEPDMETLLADFEATCADEGGHGSILNHIESTPDGLVAQIYLGI